MKKRKKQLIKNTILTLFFTCGMLLFLYPFYVNALNHFIDTKRVNGLQEITQKIGKEKKQKIAAANKQVRKRGLHIGNIDFDTAKGTHLTKKLVKEHLVGSISIPSIHVNIPLFDRTNSLFLQEGATLVQGTSYPTGEANEHTVIAAHSGIPERKLFTNLEQVKLGDQFVVTVGTKKLAYQVDRIKVVKPTETQSLQIEANKNLVTLVTCTPYMINTHRLLVTGHRVPYTEKVAQQVTHAKEQSSSTALLILFGTSFLLVVVAYLIYRMIARYRMGQQKITVSLQIWNKNQKTIADFPISLYHRGGKKKAIREGVPIEGKTDATGIWRIENLPKGNYCVKTSQGTLVLRLRFSLKKDFPFKEKFSLAKREAESASSLDLKVER